MIFKGLLEAGIEAVGVVGEEEFEGPGGGGVFRGGGEGGLFVFHAVVGEGVEEVEEVGDFVFSEAEISEVVVVDGFGVVGDAPAFGFEVSLVVELEDFAKGGDAAVVEVGSGEFDVAEAGRAEFPEICGIFGHGEKAGVNFAKGRGSEVVVAKIGEEGVGPVLGFEEVAVSAACGGAVDFEAAFLGEGEGGFVSGPVAVEGGIEGAEEGIL